jgi:DnaJ family protein C protein 28
MSDSGRIERGIDRQIEEAQRQGKFENLPGKGKPIRPESFVQGDDDNRLAFKMLKDNNFVLPWMEKGQRIDKDLEAARKALTQSWLFFRREGQVEWVTLEWRRARNEFRRRISEVNALIRDYNLEIPNIRFERFVINPEAEIEKIQKIT